MFGVLLFAKGVVEQLLYAKQLVLALFRSGGA